MKPMIRIAPDRPKLAPPVSHRWARTVAALTIVGAMTLSAIASGFGQVEAQSVSAGTAAAVITPADTVLYFGLSLDKESAQWQLAEELLLRAGSDSTIDDIIDDMATGSDASEVESILGGEAAFVVTNLDALSTESTGGLTEVFGEVVIPSFSSEDALNVGAGAPAGFAAIIQPGDLAAATAFLEKDLAEQASSQDIAIDSTEYNGVTIKSLPGDDLSGETGTAYAIVGEFIVVSETPADLEAIVDTAAGGDSIADLEAFTRADEALAGDRLGFGFANGTALTEGVSSLDTSGMGLGNAFDGMLGGGGHTGLSVIADPAGFRINTVEIPAGDTAAEQAQEPASPIDMTFAYNVPAGSLLFANGMNLGQGALLQSLGMVVVLAVNGVISPAMDPATPVAIPSVDRLYQQAALLVGFNLKTDFIDQMVGEYGFALWGTLSDDLSEINAVLVSDTETPTVVADAVSKLSLLIQAAAQGQANVTTRVIGDSTVSVIDITDDTGATITLEYGVVDDEFLLGIGGGIDGYLSGAAEPLSGSADYQAALAALPSEHDGVFYVNVAEAVALASSASASVLGDLSGFEDSSDLCGEFGSQAEAQAAYDEDTVEHFELDLDFDGMACDDYFASTAAAASPAAEPKYAGVRAFASVAFNENGLDYTNSILLIAE